MIVAFTFQVFREGLLLHYPQLSDSKLLNVNTNNFSPSHPLASPFSTKSKDNSHTFTTTPSVPQLPSRLSSGPPTDPLSLHLSLAPLYYLMWIGWVWARRL